MIRSLARVAAVVAAAMLLFAMQRTTPGYSEITGPIAQHGTVGTVITARGFKLRVEKIILAEKLRWQSLGRAYERDTDGVWAVAVVIAEGTPASTTLAGATWQAASGLLFDASPRASPFRGLLADARLEPGLARRGLMVFEIGRGATRNGALLVSRSRWPRLDTQLRIPIPDARIEQAVTRALDPRL